MHNQLKILTIILGFVSFLPVSAAPISVGEKDRTDLSITIYNSDLAMINDRRAINIPAGDARFYFTEVSPRINHSTALLHPVPDGVILSDQQFKMPITPADLLLQSVGQTVVIESTNPKSGEAMQSQAKVLAVDNGLIFEVDGKIETDLAGRRILYDTLPGENFSPSLSFGLYSEQVHETEIVLSYLSQGLSWQANYVARMNELENAINLSAMATLENHSGLALNAANIQLIAGAVHQAPSGMNQFESRAMAVPMAMKRSDMDSAPLSDLHLYSLPGQFDLLDKHSIQVTMFEARDIPATIRYTVAGQARMYHSPNIPEQKYKIDRYIEFDNKAQANLGQPMPAGLVRVYQTQPDNETNGRGTNALYFIGEDHISHTPENTQIRLKTGQAFDLEAVRHQRGYRRLPVQEPYRSHSEVEIETIISNGKDDAVWVNVEEVFSGEWSVINGPKSSEAHARSATWAVEVPAKGKASLKLTVRVKS